MNAVISGRNAVALLQDGDQLKSLHADAIDTFVPRKPADLLFLFGECNDLQFLENVTSERVVTHLRYARDKNDALQLLLILLDSELSKDVRQEAANALEELLSADEVAQHLLRVLYAQPLPDNADLAGALECCKMGSAKSAQNFLDALTNFQPIIREVRLAWEAIPDAVFSSAEVRAQYHADVVRDGIFRDLVMTIANGKSIDSFLMKILQNPSVTVLPEFSSILQLWIAHSRYKFTLSADPAEQHSLTPQIDSEWKKWNLRDDDLKNVIQKTMAATLQSNRAESGAFLIGIAKNIAQSYFRRLDRHERRRALIEIAECIGIVFDDKTEAEELAKLLKEKLSSLPKKYVEVLELIFFQDYREREAAKKLGIPVDRLYSIKSDALKRLRKLCAKDKRFKTNLTSQNRTTLHDEQPLAKREQKTQTFSYDKQPLVKKPQTKRATPYNEQPLSKRSQKKQTPSYDEQPPVKRAQSN